MRSRRPSSRSACSRTASGMPASSIFVRYSSTTEPSSSPSSRRIDSICLRSKYSRCCLPAPSSTSSRMLLAHLQLGQALALERQRLLQALGDVERLEQLDLLLEGQVGRVAGGVGQRAGLGDGADPGGDAAVVAAQLEDLLDRGAVLALELARAAVDGHVVGVLGRPRRAGGRGRRSAAAPAMPRATPSSIAPRAPPGRRTRSVTRAIVPTEAYSPSWRGTRRTRSSSPTSTGSVTSIVGKTTVSSRGMRSSVAMVNLCMVQLLRDAMVAAT